MRHGLHPIRGVLAALCLAALAGSAAAQTGRVGGIVKDEAGQPIKGATVTAENPDASPSSFTATTDDKGRFSIIGLKTRPLDVHRAGPGLRAGVGQAARRDDRRAESAAHVHAEEGRRTPPAGERARRHGRKGSAGRPRGCRCRSTTARSGTKRSPRIAAIMAKAPALSVINLQIAAAYRNKKDYDNAIAAYNDLLKADPNNDKAIVGIGMTNLEKGDLKAAEDTLTKAAEGPSADARGVLQPRRGEVRQGTGRRGGEVVPEGGRRRPDVGQAALQARARGAQQGRQGRRRSRCWRKSSRSIRRRPKRRRRSRSSSS